uniref:Uncharacterized protein n=1 Tax=Arundo donax TaxID=35708 RepID=A0A0A8Y2T2_ARUDO
MVNFFNSMPYFLWQFQSKPT